MNTSSRCEGAIIGHAIASRFDPSVFMAHNVTESLLHTQQFNGSDILSRHLYLYHSKKCEVGEATKYVYQEALTHINTSSSITRENFLFNQTTIDEMVQIADKKYNGLTAGCGPAQRSYPIALCHHIQDDDVFDFSMLEAKLTHHSPLAGQVAGIVNVIVRRLLKNESWNDAVNAAFRTPRLHEDIRNILGRRHSLPNLAVETHVAYAPTVLNAAIHFVSSTQNAPQAVSKAYGKDKNYCTPIVGVLAGARWGIPVEIYRDNINDTQLNMLRESASKLSATWPAKLQNAKA